MAGSRQSDPGRERLGDHREELQCSRLREQPQEHRCEAASDAHTPFAKGKDDRWQTQAIKEKDMVVGTGAERQGVGGASHESDQNRQNTATAVPAPYQKTV